MIGIIAAMEEETRSLLENMQEKETEEIHHLFYIKGKIGEQTIVIAQSGIGKVNSALATAFMIDRYQPKLVINTGSAGALKAGLAIGDVLVAKEVAYHDVDATAFGYVIGQVPQMPASYQSDARVIEKMEEAIQKVGLRAEIGSILSSDSFIADSEAVNNIKSDFPDAGATEMEGASIAQTCHVMGVPFVVVRAISDSADQEASVSFDEFIETAGKKSAEMVMAFLNAY